LIAHNVEARTSLVDIRPQRVVLRPNFWSRNRRSLSIIFACVIFSGSLTFGALWMHVGVFSSPNRTEITSQPAHHISGGLGLRVQAENDRLLVSWDREATAIENAANGSLVIDDGSSHRQIQLDGGQVANGSVLYKPHSDDVSFRLLVTTDAGATAQDTVRVLGDSTLPLMNRVARVSLPHPETPVAFGALDGAPKALPQNSPSDAAPSDQAISAIIPKTTSTEAPVKLAASTFVPKPPIELDMPGPSATNFDYPQVIPSPAPFPKAVPPSDLSYQAPEPLKRVTPNVRTSDLGSLGGTFETDLRVHIDEKGRVGNVSIMKGGFNSNFNAMVMQAAQAWTFVPARLHGKNIASDYIIVFRFKSAS
jgi:TonB family protein